MLADAVAAARDEESDRVRLQLKTIRPAGGITFKGCGRGAAEMTAAYASRLVIAVAGSLAAKHAAEALAAFRDLKPVCTENSSSGVLVVKAARMACDWMLPIR
jgi:hypothetical protein